MTDFKVGDKVRTVGSAWPPKWLGAEGEIAGHFENGTPKFRAHGSEYAWGIVGNWGAELVQAANVAQEEANEASDAINPPRSSPTYQIVAESDFEDEVWQVLIPLGKLIISKNKQYGDAALNPRNVFSKLAPGEGIKLRMDDKLSRIERGDGTGDEDAHGDLMGYLTLLKIAERRAS